MNKVIMTTLVLFISIIMIEGTGGRDAYADAAETPMTLTKEADTVIDRKEEEKQTPDTGDKGHASAAVCTIVIAGTIGLITVGTTSVSHKNT